MNRQILEEAAEWFVEFRAGSMEARTRHAFMRWLRRSPENIQAYIEVAGAYARIPTPAALDEPMVRRLIGWARRRADAAPSEEGRGLGEVLRLPHGAGVRQQKRSRLHLALAASVLLVAGVGALLWHRSGASPVYATQTGEQRAITLPDGSRVELNARSKVTIGFTSVERRIELLEGQALFQVARDPRRPFVVDSGGTRVRALGTRFDVYRKKTGTVVTVLEGLVTVIPDRAGPSAAIAFVGAGEQVTVTQAAPPRRERANVGAATAWTAGQLEFDEARLGDVVEEFNRHNTRAIVIESAPLDELRVTGVYSSTDPASFLRFLDGQPGVTVRVMETQVRVSQD